ncbi:hypothetical protein DC522_26240 [Microvirga sp. KLBC 81]|nr:hypothetical protein DC522_26240 [Microvirga sp. KLBC 81]
MRKNATSEIATRRHRDLTIFTMLRLPSHRTQQCPPVARAARYQTMPHPGRLFGEWRLQELGRHGRLAWLGVAYQQWWHTPYVGLGATYATGSWRVTREVITSPFVVAEDKDHHNQWDLLFTEDFAPDWKVGLSLGAEYAVSVRLSLTAKRGCLSSEAFFGCLWVASLSTIRCRSRRLSATRSISRSKRKNS